jgi:hypothetical protein
MKKLITTGLMLASLSTLSFAQSKAGKTQVNVNATTSAPASQQTKEFTANTILETINRESTKETKAAAKKTADAAKVKYALNKDQYEGIYQTELMYNYQVQQLGGMQPGEGQKYQMELAREMGYKKFMSAQQFSQYEATLGK